MSTEPQVLTTHTITRANCRFEFHINADGTGVCIDKDGDPSGPIPIKVDINAYRREALTASLEADESFFENYFDEIFADQVRAELQDPILEDSCPEGYDIEFLCGSEAALRNEAKLVLQAFPELFSHPNDAVKLDVTFISIFDDGCGGEVRLEYEDVNPEGELWEELLEEVRVRNEFTGCEFLYNDGLSDRMSGYSPSGLDINIAVSKPSAEETAAARKALIKLGIAEVDDFTPKPEETS
jgi:hypothetical protein